MAASTSRAAPSMSRDRSNWMVMLVVPRLLDEVISVTPAMWPNWRSSGVATEDAMISALPPGRPALTLMVGKSTCGSGETGRKLKAIAPAMAMAIVSSVVATGRKMNGREMFTRVSAPASSARLLRLISVGSFLGRFREAVREVVEEDVDDGRGVEGEHLAQQKAANHGDAERPAKLRPDAAPEGERQNRRAARPWWSS